MTRRKIPKLQPGELPWATRIELAIDEYKSSYTEKGKASFRALGKRYDVHWENIRDHIVRGAVSREVYAQARQRLTPAEEDVLQEHCLQLEKWGCPARISQLKQMAEDLLIAKGDTAPIGVNWPSAFMKRHPLLKSVFTTPQDRNRQLSEDYDIIAHWFDLYRETVEEHDIQPEDTYNMDEKGAAMGVIGKQRCIVSKSEKRPKSTQDGSREWVTLVECISLKGKVLSPWIIFKGKIQQLKWTERLRALRSEYEFPGHICVSENGWTDNELGIEWLKECFEPETTGSQKGEWRLLLWDGHSSHISITAIKYCLEKQIIPLCLPPHTTHLLQPCDVGLFGPEATLYKNAIARHCRPGAHHSIDKIMFLEVYCEIRPQALCQHNIEHAWRDSGLLPFNPDIVLSKLKKLSNSRPSTAQGAPPSLDTTTPSLVIPLRPGKTPHNVTEVQQLVQELKDGKIEQSLGIDKLAKATQFSLAKVVIIEAQNTDLVEAAKEKVKRRNKQAGNLGRARAIGGKKKGLEALEQAQKEELNKLWKAPPREDRSSLDLGFGRIAADIFTWEITSQRRKIQPTKPSNPSNPSLTRTPTTPSKPIILPSSRPLILPLIKLPLRSILRTPTPSFSTPKRRQQKVATRRQRAQKEQVIEVKEVVTHLSKRGRLVRHKIRD